MILAYVIEVDSFLEIACVQEIEYCRPIWKSKLFNDYKKPYLYKSINGFKYVTEFESLVLIPNIIGKWSGKGIGIVPMDSLQYLYKIGR